MNQVDVLIVGGGIAGLWTLARLTKLGYSALLLEADALGCGQTMQSQGIIHGGLKYALNGQLSSNVNALQDMPTTWRQCLQNNGEVDLQGAQILAHSQYLWSVNKLTGGLTTLFASSALKSHVDALHKEDWPSVITHSAIQSKLYKLSELVLDIPSVVRALATPLLSRCIKLSSADFDVALEGNNIKYVQIKTGADTMKLQAQKYIFTAGKGNGQIIKSLRSPAMQTRPLHMVLVKSRNLSPLYGHCVGLNTVPRVTITTHTAQDNTPVWYLGGKLAEDGVARTSEQQIDFTKKELQEIFPQLDLTTAQFATFFIDRAEAKQPDGTKPASATMFAQHNYISAWPTKLALAPILAQQIISQLQNDGIKPSSKQIVLYRAKKPDIATPIWDQLLCN